MNPEKKDISKLSYVELMARIGEINRPPGGKNSVRLMVQNSFLTEKSRVLDVGCNTGYCTFEVAHLAKCKVTGVDISPDMIKKAKEFRIQEKCEKMVEFKTADGERLPFDAGTFDLVFSGGSTAFIGDKKKAIGEYRRVAKEYGFVADINFFYGRKPPATLIKRLNRLMGTDIKPWGMDFWLGLYADCGLEKYFIHSEPVKQISDKEVLSYCKKMADSFTTDRRQRKKVESRLVGIMRLFNENNKYLSYGVFIYRKRPKEEQVTLFGE